MVTFILIKGNWVGEGVGKAQEAGTSCQEVWECPFCWLRAGRPRGRSSDLGGVKSFHFSISSRPVLGPTQPPVQWVSGALSPGVKLQRREADHSPPTSAEVKRTWIYTSTPQYVFVS
jgi:hypothetical protein